ncbi:Ctr copper transporter [Auriculariales sp. MPI-PUGE-AT-0066]|nr:Ctr copper transporter [Auriculariales sp. MPI-PUGE-AT-0066]
MDHSHHQHETESLLAVAKRCSMNMLWNTQVEDTCIVFRWWHIYNNIDFVIALVAVAGLGVLYEYLRVVQVKYDQRVAVRLVQAAAQVTSPSSLPVAAAAEDPLAARVTAAWSRNLCVLARSVSYSLVLTTRRSKVPVPQRLARASLYGSAVFLSFFIMLIFMTYNAYLIAAVVVGAAVGHYIFSAEMDTDAVLATSGVGGKGVSCH